jgi:hypothetical protein
LKIDDELFVDPKVTPWLFRHAVYFPNAALFEPGPRPRWPRPNPAPAPHACNAFRCFAEIPGKPLPP